ncbi:hypothetical protein [Marinomonas spartinae]|uniref:hypothetical protein n=1 Tax=Marinomonas spartinae TaxID=1792290 RepID=UPI0018F12994|nr:hypothetical protein [Marinomonas spartinae]MBJ7555381.1 hypothetical protein [Marinomonas spartinae]
MSDFINLIRIGFPEPLLLADCGHDVTFNSELYRADSTLLIEIGDVTEENQLNTTTFDVTLAGAPELVLLVRTGQWLNLPITYYRVWYENGVQSDVDVVFRGRLTEQTETDGEDQQTIQFSCSSHFIDWQSKGGRVATNASQQVYAPGDKGFEHAGKEKQNVKWGR